ncbi:MAG: hypothetical protein OXM54_06770 [Acidimicrobiaceae bacterium]|nr:hypothetical protein [Acidimicrobiaceae bacterium]
MSLAALLAHTRRDDGLIGGLTETGVGVATLVVVAGGVLLGFAYWYFANRPNVVVGPKFDRTFASVEVRNHGRTAAKKFRVKCPQLKFRGQEEPLDQQFDHVQPQQSFEYFVGVGHELVDEEAYCFEVSYRRWLFWWLVGRVKYEVKIDFESYRNVLAASEPPNKLTQAVEDLSARAEELLQMLVAERDRAISAAEDGTS